jgi:hypothetical protein
MWEHTTKQFCSKCQSSGDQPSSQSAWSTSVLISIGPCPAVYRRQASGALGIQWTQLYHLYEELVKTSLHWRIRSPCNPPGTSWLWEHSPDSHGRSYATSAIFIMASLGNIHLDHAARAQLSSQQELGRALVTKCPLSEPTQTFHVWTQRDIKLLLKDILKLLCHSSQMVIMCCMFDSQWKCMLHQPIYLSFVSLFTGLFMAWFPSFQV